MTVNEKEFKKGLNVRVDYRPIFNLRYNCTLPQRMVQAYAKARGHNIAAPRTGNEAIDNAFANRDVPVSINVATILDYFKLEPIIALDKPLHYIALYGDITDFLINLTKRTPNDTLPLQLTKEQHEFCNGLNEILHFIADYSNDVIEFTIKQSIRRGDIIPTELTGLVSVASFKLPKGITLGMLTPAEKASYFKLKLDVIDFEDLLYKRNVDTWTWEGKEYRQ